MIHRCMFLLITFIFVNSVFCEDESINKEVHKVKYVRPMYNFNHPPFEEQYDPIPVAVVYESPKFKSEITTEAVGIDEEVKVTEESISSVNDEEETRTTVISPADSKNILQLIPKPRALSNLQIPVSVVYETDSNGYQNHKRTKTETNKESPRRLPNRRRNQRTKTNIGITKTQNTEKVEATEKSTTKIATEQNLIKTEPKVELRTFKKRTEGRDPVVPILESENYVFSHNGNFHYRYEGGDGTRAYSEGKLKSVDEQTGEAVMGGFSYTDKDGNDFSLSYTADENGYRPVGAHLPTPPPIPPAIARALEYLATATPEPVTTRPVKTRSS